MSEQMIRERCHADDFCDRFGTVTPREILVYGMNRSGMRPTAIGRSLDPPITWHRVKQVLHKTERKIASHPDLRVAIERIYDEHVGRIDPPSVSTTA